MDSLLRVLSHFFAGLGGGLWGGKHAAVGESAGGDMLGDGQGAGLQQHGLPQVLAGMRVMCDV